MKNYQIKLDDSFEYYYDNAPKKDYRLFSMMFVYENESGEQYASLVCDFDLVSRGYEPTGRAVFIPDNSFTL